LNAADNLSAGKSIYEIFSLNNEEMDAIAAMEEE